jgi:hypothetical protein
MSSFPSKEAYRRVQVRVRAARSRVNAKAGVNENRRRKGARHSDRETAARAGLGRRASLQKGRRPRSLGIRPARLTRSGAGAGQIGHVVGHLKDVGKAGAGNRTAGVGVLLLLGDGAVRVEAMI